MSLDNIQLPAIVLQDLYKDSLVDLNTEQSISVPESSASLSFLGNNLQKIVLVVNNIDAIYLPEQLLNFLIGILAACKLTMSDVALLNLNKKTEVTYTDISEQLKAEKIFLFGTEPSVLNLPIQFPHYQIQQYNKQVYLSAPGLEKLEINKEEKMKLWNCLKQVFNIETK